MAWEAGEFLIVILARNEAAKRLILRVGGVWHETAQRQPVFSIQKVVERACAIRTDGKISLESPAVVFQRTGRSLFVPAGNALAIAKVLPIARRVVR